MSIKSGYNNNIQKQNESNDIFFRYVQSTIKNNNTKGEGGSKKRTSGKRGAFSFKFQITFILESGEKVLSNDIKIKKIWNRLQQQYHIVKTITFFCFIFKLLISNVNEYYYARQQR